MAVFASSRPIAGVGPAARKTLRRKMVSARPWIDDPVDGISAIRRGGCSSGPRCFGAAINADGPGPMGGGCGGARHRIGRSRRNWGGDGQRSCGSKWRSCCGNIHGYHWAGRTSWREQVYCHNNHLAHCGCRGGTPGRHRQSRSYPFTCPRALDSRVKDPYECASARPPCVIFVPYNETLYER